MSRSASVNDGDKQAQSYAFDALGNRASKTNVQGGSSATETYVYDNLNELTSRTSGGSASAYTNDVLGNTLTGGGRTNTWDSQNRLVQCVFNGKTSQMTYGSDGLRRRMTTSAGGWRARRGVGCMTAFGQPVRRARWPTTPQTHRPRQRDTNRQRISLIFLSLTRPANFRPRRSFNR